MSISNYSVKKPITVVMAVLVIIILGVVSLSNLTTDLFPNINFPYAIISTSYVGASPEEVELMVTKPIENSMATVSNIKDMQSVSREHSSMVILEFNENTNMDSAMIEMRENLDMVESYLPEDVGSPIIRKLNPDMLPISNFSIALEGQTVTQSSEWIQDVLIPRFERIQGVASVSVTGPAENEIHVTLNDEKIEDVGALLAQKAKQAAIEQAKKQQANQQQVKQQQTPQTPGGLKDFNITKDMIAGILKGQNFSMPGGYITDNGKDYMVRTGDKLEDAKAVEDLMIMHTPYMDIRVKDVADVEFSDTSEDSYTKVNGENAVMVSVQKQSNYATTDVAKKVDSVIGNITDQYDNVKIVMLMDQAEYIGVVIKSVTNNLLIGAALAILILLLFLRDYKPTVVIGLAIPISVISTFILTYFADITLNVVSMGGLALGIGMLVDNSIVVIENIYRLRSEGKSAKQAAVEGAKQVSGAITASTLTTISVFLPVVFLKGLTAQVFKEMALTISFSLFASLLIALTLVPSMSSRILRRDFKSKRHKGLQSVTKVYTKVIAFALKHKAAVIILAVILFAASIFAAFSMGTEYFPATDEGQITVDVSMPKGTRFEDTADTLDKVSDIISKVEGVETVGASIGGGFMFGYGGGSDSGSVYVLLSDDTSGLTSDVAKEIRDKTKDLDCELSISDQSMNMSAMSGTGISILIRGHDFDKLEEIANDIYKLVEDIDGVVELDNGISKTSPELKITVDRDKSVSNGITTAQVFAQVNKAIKKEDVATKLSLDGKEYDIKVLDSKSDTTTYDVKSIKNINIESPLGENVKVSDVASVEIKSGYSSINRDNQERSLTVSMSVKEDYNIGNVNTEVKKALESYNTPEGYTVTPEGEGEEISKAFNDLLLAMILAVLLIYMVMAAQFQSFLYPFIIMFTIPLAFTGGFIALIATGSTLSIVALIGLIILSGVVVNNGIVLVDYINQLKDNGIKTRDAVIQAGKTRLRPIVMTALTTILALSTMAVGLGKGAELIQPMAITAIGGLIYATLLTLIVVPVIYSGLDKIKAK